MSVLLYIVMLDLFEVPVHEEGDAYKGIVTLFFFRRMVL